MNFRPHSRSPHGPETMRLHLIALIDVVLFILLYFMLSAKLVQDAGELSAGIGATGAGKSSALMPQILTVELADNTPTFRIGGRVVKAQGELASLLALLPREQGLFVKVSSAAPIDAAAVAIQAAKDAGFTKVSYVPMK